MHTQNDGLSYAEAGVNIEAGNQLVERIKPLAAATKRTGVMQGLGGFGGLFDLKACGYDDPVLVSGTDGVGTKLRLAIDHNRHDSVGIDLVAMCVNDILAQGAEPLLFLDYFACGELEEDRAADVIAGIAKGCSIAGCALLGGETAEMPGMYVKGEYDLAGFAVGAAERTALLPKGDAITEGDALIGLASSGVHSNGYSLVRAVLNKAGIAIDAKAPFAADDAASTHKSLLDHLMEPTRIYVQSCLPLAKTGSIKALAHITGGGLTENIPRVLRDDLAAEIACDSWNLPPLFAWLQEAGAISDAEMRKTFNCGIGMVVVCAKEQAASVTEALNAVGEDAKIIGEITKRSGDDAPSVTYI